MRDVGFDNRIIPAQEDVSLSPHRETRDESRLVPDPLYESLGPRVHAPWVPGRLGGGPGGQQVGRAAGRTRVNPGSPLTLANGGTASSVLRVVNVGNYPVSICHARTAAGLRVYPPDSGLEDRPVSVSGVLEPSAGVPDGRGDQHGY